MAKPSVTNLKPPSKTPVWTPPVSTWDLNTSTAGAEIIWNTGDDAAFATAVDAVLNTTEASTRDDLETDELGDYDYAFFGVNGGEDETVIGISDKAGIIVTGNGSDTITGGGLDDLIFSGNGRDVIHGGAGDDIIFGENGADDIHGDSDNGTASYSGGDGQLVLNDDAVILPSDPDGTSIAVAVPSKTTISKEGVYVAVDGDGHPTETDGDGNPILHMVYSVTPETTGDYTIAYTHGNGLDGAGDPAFTANDTDILQIHLTAGQQYFFSITYDPGHPTIQVELFAGLITPTGTNADPQTVATSQAVPDVGWETLFHVEDGELEFAAGDELIGGNGPDAFIYDPAEGPNNVDLIWDYNQGDGTYNALEGDTLVITGAADLTGAVIGLLDLDEDGDVDDLVIYFSEDHAIGLVGISDIADVSIVFAP